MSRLLEVQLRHSSHYLNLLRSLGDQFTAGREALKNALTQYESESDNIDVGFDSAERQAKDNTQAAQLCTEYANAAPHLLNFRQQPLERLRWLEAALATSNNLDNRVKARLLLGVGINHLRLAESVNAMKALDDALAICRDVSEPDTEAEVLSCLGTAYIASREYERAVLLLERSLSIARDVKNPRTECVALNSLGRAHYMRREFQQAIEYHEASLRIADERGFLPEEGTALTSLGRTYAILDRPLKAIETQQQSLSIAREIGDKRSEMSALAWLGQAHYVLGKFEEAVKLLSSALPLARQLGDGVTQVEILTLLGDSHLDSDRVDLAVESYKQRTLIKRSLAHDRMHAIEHILLTEPVHANGLEVASHQAANLEIRTSVVEVVESREAGPVTPAMPSGSVTWLHLSDLHFRESSAYDANVVLEPLLDDIKKLKTEKGLSPDFIAITGDIAFSGKPDEYLLAVDFFEKLLETTDLSREKLFIVPGNHDVNASLVERVTRNLGNTVKDRDIYSDVVGSPGYWKLFLGRFEGWADFFNNYFTGLTQFDHENYYYTKTLNIGDIRVALLGLNSVWLSHPEDDNTHRLVLGERQVRDAVKNRDTANAHIKIALMHHPKECFREFDVPYSWEYLADACNFVLHGHLHRAGIARIETPGHAATVIAGGACYATREHPNSYNLVKLDLKSKSGTIYFRGYSDNRGGFWTEDNRLYRNLSNGMHNFTLRL